MKIRQIAWFLPLALLATSAVPPSVRGDSATLTNAKACRKAVDKQGRNYAKKRLKLLLGCVDKLLKCEILLEVDGTNANSCRSKAEDSCVKTIGPASDSSLSKTGDKFDTLAGTACLPFGTAAMESNAAGGLWYSNDGTCGGSGDIPTLLACLRGEIDVRVDTLVGEVKPRASLLLDSTSLGVDFPNIPRPPTVTVVISATAPASGVLVNPGTINVPQGSALKFTGDATTLPCGGPGMSGRVTITVGTGSTAQQRTIKEPWGPNEAAVFGPYIVSGDQPYTLDYKDQSCNDTTSGTVHTP